MNYNPCERHCLLHFEKLRETYLMPVHVIAGSREIEAYRHLKRALTVVQLFFT